MMPIEDGLLTPTRLLWLYRIWDTGYMYRTGNGSLNDERRRKVSHSIPIKVARETQYLSNNPFTRLVAVARDLYLLLPFAS